MKRFLLFVWQLPQNILGAILWLILSRRKPLVIDNLSFYTTKQRIGISLGEFIIIGTLNFDRKTLYHEHGHQIQSQRLGLFYLIIIGLPSICGNIIDRLFHKKWSYTDRYNWYHNLPWEKNADSLGKVDTL